MFHDPLFTFTQARRRSRPVPNNDYCFQVSRRLFELRRIPHDIDREKMKIPPNVVDQLVAGAQSDIRQVLNMLSTWKLSSNSMNFDESKNLYVWHCAPVAFRVYFAFRAKSNEKFPIMTPFDVLNKMMGPYLFSQTARETLGDKMELYFHDHSFVPLFIQVRSRICFRTLVAYIVNTGELLEDRPFENQEPRRTRSNS